MLWMYNETGPKLFASEADVPEGEGWVDSPAKVAAPETEASEDDMREALKAAGVKVDGRWGVDRLKEELAKVGHGDDA